MMSATFRFEPTDDGGRIALLAGDRFGRRPVPVSEWPASDATLLPAIRHLRRLVEEGTARADGIAVVLTSDQLADLPPHTARTIGLPGG
jgi:hypothetical protein